MRSLARTLFLVAFGVAALTLMVGLTEAQPGPGGRFGDKGPRRAETAADFVQRLMAFDKNKDGKLGKDEIIDARLHALFDRADANKDGVVTRAELEALFEREAGSAGFGGEGRFGPDGEGPKGPPPFGKGPKGPGGFGPPRPGLIMPPFLQDELKLSDAQKRKLATLQKEVDARLEKILTDEQRVQWKEMRQRGPGRFGPKPAGPGGYRAP